MQSIVVPIMSFIVYGRAVGSRNVPRIAESLFRYTDHTHSCKVLLCKVIYT